MNLKEFRTLKVGESVKLTGSGYDRGIPCYVKEIDSKAARATLVKQDGKKFKLPSKYISAKLIGDDCHTKSASFRFLMRCEDTNKKKATPKTKKAPSKTTTTEKVEKKTTKKVTTKKVNTNDK